MSVPVEEEQVLAHEIGRGEGLLDVAELQVDQLLEVAAVAVGMNPRLGMCDRVQRVSDGTERLVLHGDQVQRGGRDLLAHGGDAGDGIAHESGLVQGQGVLVLAHREDAEGDRQVLAGQDGLYAGERQCPGRVDANDARVRMRAPQQFGVEHPRQEQVVGEPGRAGDLGGGVGLAVCFPHHP